MSREDRGAGTTRTHDESDHLIRGGELTNTVVDNGVGRGTSRGRFGSRTSSAGPEDR